MSVNYSCIGAVWRCESCLPKGISRGQLPETAELKGRGLQGRGRRSDKGPITVTEGISERQKKPSVLSRQRSRVRAPSSPPYIPNDLRDGLAKKIPRNWVQFGCILHPVCTQKSD